MAPETSRLAGSRCLGTELGRGCFVGRQASLPRVCHHAGCLLGCSLTSCRGGRMELGQTEHP